MTKEKIFEKYDVQDVPKEDLIHTLLDEYAKSVAIGFIEYHDKFRREEGRWAQREYKKAGGIFTWMGKDVTDVYDDYINKKPIESYLAPEGIVSFWSYNDKGQLVHSSETLTHLSNTNTNK
jgi:hypothetical protein